MNGYFIGFKRIFSLFIGIWLMVSAAYGEDKKLLVVGEEFPPFEFRQNGKVVGIDIDIATHIFNKMDIPVKFDIIPWKLAWYMVEKGRADAVLSTSRKKKRKSYVWYPQEDMWVSEFVFFVRKDNIQPDFRGYETAVKKKLKIGFINGNSYHPSFWKAFPYKDGSTVFKGDMASVHDLLNNQLDGVSNLKINLRKLAKGRVDLFPADKTCGVYTANLLGLGDKLTFYDAVLYSKPYPMPFVRRSGYPGIKIVAEKFEQELKLLKNGGEYKKIFDKWLEK
ncbi:MAG: amino acid ABC transporter substrate-binding protein [Desulfobacteraceae bacterium]|nr:amino acid ABC transporter substrate-binding protein [Desulfobacteraceae bacterium]